MEITLRAIINHLNTIPELKTVEEYTYQINSDGIKQTVKLPAALVANRNGFVRGNSKGMNFDILVVSQTKSFDKKDNIKTNLELVTTVMEHLDNNPGFDFLNTEDSTTYNFLIDQDSINATKLMSNDRFIIYIVKINIRYL